MGEHPDDCAIQITYDASATQLFRFTRLPSRGPQRTAIALDANGDLAIDVPEVLPGLRLSISFVLPDDYSSGGFAGIKIWPEGRRGPKDRRKRTGPIPGTPFYLHVYHEGKAREITALSLVYTYEDRGHFRYRLGLATDSGLIESHDPRIYNTGPVGR